MDGFYVGSFFVEEFPTPVQQDWLFPNNLEHSRDTSNVEELNINPEDLILFPEEIQAGSCNYTVTFTTLDPDFYVEGLGVDLGFYFRHYTDLGFYFRDLPTPNGFYTSHASVLDFYAITAPGTGGFYVNYDNIYDFYAITAPGLGGFYITSGLPNDFYIIFSVG